MRIRERFQSFMTGRNGADELSRLSLVVTLVLLVVSAFTGTTVISTIFSFAGLVLLIYSYYRMFSRNLSKMQAQNQKYLNWKYSLAVKKDKRVRHMQQRKIYHFYTCPNCRQKVRVPKGRGKICITCPKCRTEFIKKS